MGQGTARGSAAGGPGGGAPTGIRMRSAAPVVAGGERDGRVPPPVAASASPRLGRALAAGVAAALGMALVWTLLAGLLDVSWGLVFMAAIGGYIVALAVVAGAFGDTAHPTDRRVQAIATMLALAVWLLGTFGAYVVGLIILPGSNASLTERMAHAPFIDSVVNQFALLDIAELALLPAVAWRSAR